MRRFSQKNALVTLSDINVTPLLDLAFVLLIIFVITTPLLEQSVQLELPVGGKPEAGRLERKDIKTVEITQGGEYKVDGKTILIDQLERVLVDEHRRNPRMVVNIRGDQRVPYGAVFAVLDRCQRNGITKVNPLGTPPR